MGGIEFMSVLQAERRAGIKAEKLRRQGILPMALVERSHATTLLQTTEPNLKKAMMAADGLGRLDLEIDGEKGQRKVIVKNIERDFLKHQILTVTLQEVAEDDVVKMDILVIAMGEVGEFEQNVTLMHQMDHLKVRGKMNVLPERLEVDVSHLTPGDHINAGDIALPEGVDLLSSPDSTVFSLQIVKEVSLEPETTEEGEAGAAEDGEAGAAAEPAAEEEESGGSE